MSVLFSKCLKSELETNMEGYQANPHFNKITFSYSDNMKTQK